MASYEMGFINVPIAPTFVGIAGKMNDGLIKPAREAGRKAAVEVEKSTQDMVKSLERQVAASSKKVADLERAHGDSISKRESQQGKLNAAIAEQTAAEEKYQDALKKGNSGLSELAKLERAKARVTDETLKLTKAERDATDAEQKHKSQLEDLQRTTEKYEKAQKGANEEAKSGTSVFDKLRQQIGLAGTEMDDTANKAGGLGDKIMSGLGKVGTGALLGVGAKIGSTVVGSINTAFDKGFGRLQSIEQAETMLGGLGHSAEGIAEIMDNAMDSVSGTAYGFGEAASMAATFAGAGVEQGEELTRILSLVGDSAAITGADFQEMGSIWTKMASSGKLSTDEMNQLMDRGLGLLPKLQEHYNVTADEARKMVTEGKVSFEDFAEVMEDMVGGSSQAMGDTFSGSAANMQAALGRLGAKFMDPIYEVAPSIFQAIGGSVDKLGEYLGPVIEDFAERFAPLMQDFAERLGPWLEESIDKAADAVKGLVEWGREAIDWMKENRQWLKPLAAAVAGAAGAWMLWTGAIKAWQKVTKIATGIQAAFNTVMALNPIMLVVMAVAALAAGLVYFFTRTEKGQELWEKFTTALGEGWDWFTDKIGAGIEWITEKFEAFTGWLSDAWEGITSLFKGDFSGAMYDAFGISDDSPIIVGFFFLRDTVIQVGEIIGKIWDGIVTAGKIAFAIIGTVVLTPLILAWEALSSAWQWSYENVIRPVIDAFADAGLWLWEQVINPVLTWIGDKWSTLSDWLASVWESIRTAVFDAFMWYIDQVRANWDIVTGALSTAWSWLRDIFVAVFEEIRTRVFNVFNFYVDLLRSGFDIATGAMAAAWEWLRDILGSAWSWMRDNVFVHFQGTIDTVKSAFETAVDAIAKAWSSLKALLAEPVNFIIREVYMGGVREAWGKVASLVDLPDLPEVKEIRGYARGGILPGFSRMIDGDDQLVPMRRGEGVLVSEGLQDQTSRRLFLAANAEAKQGKSFAKFLEDYVAGYASGGIVGSLNSIMREFYPELQLTSHFRPGDSGYHGKNMAGDFSNTGSGMPSTPAMQAAAKFMFANYGDQLEQLIHHPARNIGSGMDVGDGFGYYGAATMYGHTDHIHLAALKPLVDPSGVVQMMPYDGEGGGGFSLGSMVKSLWDSIIGRIGTFTDGAGLAAQLPGAFLGKIAGAAWDFISSRVGAFFGASGSVGNAESWRDMAVSAMKRNGFNTDDPAQVDAMLAQIMSESGGNPGIAQQIVDVNGTGEAAGVGLLQIIPGTFAAHRDPELPDDRRDPWANMNAALRYYKSRYGTDLTTMWGHGHGYAEGGIVDLFTRDMGGWVPSGALVRNTSGRDELMLPPELSQAMTGFFNDYPEAASSLADAAVSIETASEWLAQAADYSSSEGAVARAVTRGILGIGIDLPGADLVSGFLDAEEAIWESRLKYSKHVDNVVAKEKALADALEALDELGSGDGELGTKDQRKIDDATAKVEEAKADLAKADSDEKRAKAADKLADAEEKLRRVREDLDESAAKDAKKHAEDIAKANEAVAKAESELVEAKRQQASDLHAITILSQDSLAGMESQAVGFADQLLGMGAPAGMVSQGLGAVTGALASVAGMAGPAGLTLGMALDIAKAVIQLVQMLEQMWKEIVEKITTYRTALLTGQADFLAGIAEINSLVSDQKMEIVSLANEWVDATLRMRDAIRGITEAAVGVLSANLQGAQAIADIQKKILDARSGSGGSGSSGGSAFTDLHDMGLLYDSHADRLTATPRIKSTGGSSGGSVSDIAASVDEIAALEWELLAAEKNHSIMLIDAMIGMVDAQFEQIQATRDLERLEEDRDRAWARLLHMQEIQTQFAINEQQAIVQEQINELLRQNAEAESVLLDPMNRLADLLDLDGDGTFFGLFTNKGSIAVQAAQNAIAANNAQIEKLIAMQAPYGGTTEITPEMQATLEKAARLFAEGMDREAQWLLDSSTLGDPARALQIIDLASRLEAIDANNLALEREWEDLELRLDHIEATEGLESLREGLQHDREFALASAEILRATSDEVRAAAEALRDYHAQAAAQKPTVVTVHVPAAGTVVDADVLDQTLNQLGQQLDGVEIRTERLENAGKPTGGSVLVSKS